MYNLFIEFLDKNGNIQDLSFTNITYISFRFYNITFLEYKQKNFTTINNVLNFSVTRV